MNKISFWRYLFLLTAGLIRLEVAAQQAPEIKGPAYLEFSAGMSYLHLRDAGVSPLLFSGPLLLTQGAWHKEGKKMQWRADFGFATGEIEKAQSFVVNSDVIAFYHGISALRSLRQGKRLQLLGGLHYHGFSNYRVTPAFRNNASVVESINTLFAGGKADYTVKKQFRERKILFIRRKGGERAFRLSTQLNLPLLHGAWRPGFAYLDDFTGGDNTVGRDNEIRIGGFRAMARTEFTTWMRNGNAWKLSYHWDTQRSPGALNRLETASHTLAFSLLMRLN
jgi:hypothetical protein